MDFQYSDYLEKALQALQGTMQIHNWENLYAQYYELNLPFTIQLATNRPTDFNSSYRFVTFAPDNHTNINLSREFMEVISDTPALHQINCTKLMYVLEGNIYQNIEGKRILYTPGSCSLINRNLRHTEEFDTDYQVVFFNLSDVFIERIRNYNHSFLFAKENTYNNLFLDYLYADRPETGFNFKAYLDFYPVLYEENQKATMHDIFEQMIGLLLNPDFGSTYQLLALFCNLIDVLCNTDFYETTCIQSTSSIDSIIFTRINQLLYDSNGRISRGKLEELLSYSGSYLNRIVKKYTGMSLFQYSMTFCLAAASDLLLNTDESIAAIMEKLHFANQTHFYHLFKDKYGMSPKEYRLNNFDKKKN